MIIFYPQEQQPLQLLLYRSFSYAGIISRKNIGFTPADFLVAFYNAQGYRNSCQICCCTGTKLVFDLCAVIRYRFIP